jgi:hypothetical protein
MQQRMVSQADQCAYVHELGVLRHIYRDPSLLGCSVWTLLSIGFSLGFMSVPILAWSQNEWTLSWSLFWTLLWPVLFFLVGLLMCILSIVGAIDAYRKRGTSLLLYEYGLVRLHYHDKELVTSDAIHWKEVAVVWHEIDDSGNDPSHKYRLQRWDGTMFGGDTFRLDSQHAKPIKVVEQETLRSLWPETIDT